MSNIAHNEPVTMSMFEDSLKHFWIACKQSETFEFHNENFPTGYYFFPLALLECEGQGIKINLINEALSNPMLKRRGRKHTL